jgi:ABC-2 type transport system ATP-binding protein
VIGSRTGGALDSSAVRAALSAVPGVSGVESEEGEGHGTLGFRLRFSHEDPRRSLFEAVVKNEWVLLSLNLAHVSLEETFRKLTAVEGGKAA